MVHSLLPTTYARRVVTLYRFYELKGEQTVRVSVGADGTSILACISKNRLANIDFSNPTSKCDFRISASTETAVPLPKTEPSYMRHKDRMSYQFEIWSIDLSKVTTYRTLVRANRPLSAICSAIW